MVERKKDKWINNDIQNITKKTKDRTIQTSLNSSASTFFLGIDRCLVYAG